MRQIIIITIIKVLNLWDNKLNKLRKLKYVTLPVNLLLSVKIKNIQT